MESKPKSFEEMLKEAEKTVENRSEKLVERVYGPIIATTEQKALLAIRNGEGPEILLNEELNIVYRKGGLYQGDNKIETILDAAKIYQEDYNEKARMLVGLNLRNGKKFPEISIEEATIRLARDFEYAAKSALLNSIDRDAEK